MIIINTFLIVDGHSLAHRAFHALNVRLAAPDGTPTAMIVGFINMLFKVKDELQPDCVITAFDASGKTSGIHNFRYDLQNDYKATRAPLPDDLRIQLPILQTLLKHLGCKVIMHEGVEADDVVASVTRLVKLSGGQTVILSSDKDLFQLLADDVVMMRPIKNGISGAEVYDARKFADEFGFPPSSMADYLALTGDKADNIKGVKGIGEKGAKDLLRQYPTIEALFSSLDELPKNSRAKLEAAGRDHIIWTRDNLIRLKDDIFINDSSFLTDCLNTEPDIYEAENLAVTLGLERLLQRLGSHRQPVPRILDRSGRSLMPQADVFSADYKHYLKCAPRIFEGSPKVWDLHTAYYLLHPDESGSKFEDIHNYVNNSRHPSQTLAELAGGLNAEMCDYDGLSDLMNNIDLPLIPVLIRMENHGVRISPEGFEALRTELEAKILELEDKLIRLTGMRINMNSPQQVAQLLFGQLGFTPKSRTKAGAPSVDVHVLTELAKSPNGEIPRILLEYREISKMLAGFVVPLMRAAGGDNIIHTIFDPAMTGTGRLSSHDPNLQNIPAFGEWAGKIKASMLPREEGNVFVAADYSQVELRVLAYMSGEPRLLEAFEKGRDIHTQTASWVFGVMPELVTGELRRTAKMINFGLLYGMTDFGLAERLGVSRSEAKDIMKKYFAALPGIRTFIDEIVEQAKERGYSRTVFGRIRRVNEIPAKASALTRALINSPIQGTAADIARIAMIKVERELPGRMFLQVHDSIVCECRESEADEVGASLREIMIKAGGCVTNLEVEIKGGKTLADV